jgi:hypothetical protein
MQNDVKAYFRGGLKTWIRVSCALCMAGVLLWGSALTAWALINPSFTPVHLTEQSKQIMVIKLGAASAEGHMAVTVEEQLKGEAPKTKLVLDISTADTPQVEYFKKILALSGKSPIVLFVGDYREGEEAPGMDGDGMGDMGGMEGMEGARNENMPEAFLHVDGKWFSLYKGENGSLMLDTKNDYMQATWAGGSDMLVAVTKYCLTAPNPSVPSAVGSGWEEHQKIATVAGEGHGLLPVDVRSDARTWLHVLSKGGDKLFLYDKKSLKFDDKTDEVKLGSKSVFAAWGDFNSDGHLDLASYDGTALTIWLQDKAGQFTSMPSGVALQECVGLSTLGVGAELKAGLLVSTKGIPVLLSPKGDGSFTAQPIGEWKGQALGQASRCVVADFTQDGLADIVQPFNAGMILYRGQGAPGQFAPAEINDSMIAGANAFACVGDFDHNGQFDLMIAGSDGPRLWNNAGEGRFTDKSGYTGEMVYISKPQARFCMAGDVNNDGRQDVLINYSNMRTQIFFNRGYRSFGHAHQPIDLAELRWLPEADKGQRGGVLRDLDGDGAQDMALLLENGEVWVFWRNRAQGDPLCVRVRLPANAPAGPVRVWATNNKRSLGAWNVVQGTNIAFFGLFEAGQCDVSWQFPGQEVQTKSVDVMNGPVEIMLQTSAKGGAYEVEPGVAGVAQPEAPAVKPTEAAPVTPGDKAEATATEEGDSSKAIMIAAAVGVVVLILVVVLFARKKAS